MRKREARVRSAIEPRRGSEQRRILEGLPRGSSFGPYIIYFWSNESVPLEPIHVHIAEGRAGANATKLWITSTGKTIVANNNSGIPETILRKLAKVVEGNSEYIIERWIEQFDEIRYYC